MAHRMLLGGPKGSCWQYAQGATLHEGAGHVDPCFLALKRTFGQSGNTNKHIYRWRTMLFQTPPALTPAQALDAVMRQLDSCSYLGSRGAGGPLGACLEACPSWGVPLAAVASPVLQAWGLLPCPSSVPGKTPPPAMHTPHAPFSSYIDKSCVWHVIWQDIQTRQAAQRQSVLVLEAVLAVFYRW